MNKFKVGDKVKIIMSHDYRYTNYDNIRARESVGNIAEVRDVRNDGIDYYYILKDEDMTRKEYELELVAPIPDNVNSPAHYKLDGLEPYQSVDVLRASMTKIEFKGWCKGNALKYNMRERKKNGLEDLQKAGVNQEWVIEADKVIKIEKEKLKESFIDELEAIDDSGQISEEIFIKLCDLVTDIVDKTLEV